MSVLLSLKSLRFGSALVVLLFCEKAAWAANTKNRIFLDEENMYRMWSREATY